MKYIKPHIRETRYGLILVPGHLRKEALPAYRTAHERTKAASKGKANQKRNMP